jgi:hypothetical protein
VSPSSLHRLLALCVAALLLTRAVAVETVPGMPPVPQPNNLYSETAAGRLSPAVKGALPRVYVPNHTSNDVWVYDPATLKVVDKF